jgi:O-antigen/teichoic acid export membrane protein
MSTSLKMMGQELIRRGGYAPLLILALALMMARLLAAARVLEVAEFAGYSATLLVSSSFCMLGALGLQIMLQRDLPELLRRGQARHGMILLMQAVIVTMSCAIVGLLACLIFPSAAGSQALTSTAFATGVLHGLSQQFFLLVTIESRSRGRTLEFATQYLTRSLAVVTIGLSVMSSTGSAQWGAAAEAATTLAVCVTLLGRIASRAQVSIATSAILAIRRANSICWKSASMLLSVFVLSWCTQNMDRWIAERTLAIQSFAVYAFAANAMVVASAVQMTANASLFPQLARRFAASGRWAAFRLAAQFSAALAAVGLVASPVALLAWRLLIEHWFPQYEDSIEIAPMLIAVCVVRIADYWTSFLIIIGAERKLLLAAGCSIALVSIGWLVALCSYGLPTALSIAWLALALAGSWFVVALGVSWRESRRLARSDGLDDQPDKLN